MSFLTNNYVGDAIDTHSTGPLLNDVTIEPEDADLAWAYLRKHDALDLAEILGVSE